MRREETEKRTQIPGNCVPFIASVVFRHSFRSNITRAIFAFSIKYERTPRILRSKEGTPERDLTNVTISFRKTFAEFPATPNSGVLRPGF